MPKLLGEFLQEQQEPFALDIYLLERGYSIKASLDASSSIQNSARFLNRSAGCRLRKRRRAIPNCSDFVKAVFSRLVLHNNRKIKNPGNGGHNSTQANNREGREGHADEDMFSSASGTTVYNSCSESEVEDAQCIEADIRSQSSENCSLEADADRKFKWKSVEDSNKRHSPVSVLEETESDEGSPLHEKQYSFNTTQGESSTSMSQWKSKQRIYNSVEESNDSKSYAQYIINKTALQQTKQLLIDCVREVIENHRKRDDKDGQQLKKILGTEELWKLVCENVWRWSQDSTDETNIVNLLHSDFIASAEEWNSGFEQRKEEVCNEIEDAIFEEIIDELVTC